jgi:hypothetical protein
VVVKYISYYLRCANFTPAKVTIVTKLKLRPRAIFRPSNLISNTYRRDLKAKPNELLPSIDLLTKRHIQTASLFPAFVACEVWESTSGIEMNSKPEATTSDLRKYSPPENTRSRRLPGSPGIGEIRNSHKWVATKTPGTD